MYYVSKKMEIAACHKLNLSYESKCAVGSAFEGVADAC